LSERHYLSQIFQLFAVFIHLVYIILRHSRQIIKVLGCRVVDLASLTGITQIKSFYVVMMLLIKDVCTHLIVLFCYACVYYCQTTEVSTMFFNSASVKSFSFQIQKQSDPHGYKDSKYCS